MSKINLALNYSRSLLDPGVEEIIFNEDKWFDIRLLYTTQYRHFKFNAGIRVLKDNSGTLYLKNILLYIKYDESDSVKYLIKSGTSISTSGEPITLTIGSTTKTGTLYKNLVSWQPATYDLSYLLFNIKFSDSDPPVIPESNTRLEFNANRILVDMAVSFSDGTPSTPRQDIPINFNEEDLTGITVLVKSSGDTPTPTPTVTSATCSFYDYQGTLINSGTFTTRDTGNILIDDIANNIGGITVPQTKPDVRKSSGNYYVNYYLASGSSTKVGRGTDILPGGEMTISYTHKMNGNHYLWSSSLNGSEMVSTTISGGNLKFYPVFSSISTGDSPPTNFGTNPFPSANRVGYRAENGSRNNNIYYAKNGSQVSPGGGISPDMFSGTNINLYLHWVPVKYVIRFNRGDGEEWINPSNILTTVTKTYGESIKYGDIPSLDDQGYPKYEQRLYKNGFKQYGWVNNGSKVYTSGDNSYCTYKYEEDGYRFVREYIGDKWYNDNMTAVDVYPCWYPVNHKVIAHYYTTKGGTEKTDTYNFNIGSPHLSINEPKELNDKSDTWVFLGWAQSTPPKGDGWEWGSGGTDIRNYGAFRYITDLNNTKYSITYGVNSKSLTKADWDNTSKNLNIYVLWSITSRYIYLGSGWKPTTGIWVYINGKWRMIDSLYYQPENTSASPTSWKQEVVE